jgi:hypothetical protein
MPVSAVGDFDHEAKEPLDAGTEEGFDEST